MNPILFYFLEHSPNTHHITNDKLKELIARSPVVYVECVGDSLDLIEEEERNWNECISSGDLSQLRYINPPFSRLVYMLAGSEKRIVLERSVASEMEDHDQLHQHIMFAFYDSDLERSFEIAEEYLGKLIPYHQKRECRVAEDLLAIKETTTVLFGVNHLPMTRLVANKRPIETCTAFDDSAIPFQMKLWTKFRETSRLDKEMYMRTILEESLFKVIAGYRNYNYQEKEKMVSEYAQLFTADQIIQFRETYLQLSKQYSRATISDAFERFIRQNGLPNVLEMAERLFPR